MSTAEGNIRDGEGGSALIEFLGVAIVLLVPLVYLATAMLDVQRNVFAVTQGAREAGRALATAGTLGAGEDRARTAVAYALADQGVPADARITYADVGSGCDIASPDVRPAGSFLVCVSRTWTPPGIPGFLAGEGITVTGEFAVDVDEFREGG